MSEELKLCVNCVHCQVEKIKCGLFRKPKYTFVCIRIGEIKDVNMVTGESTILDTTRDCINERSMYNNKLEIPNPAFCGREGHYYEKKTN